MTTVGLIVAVFVVLFLIGEVRNRRRRQRWLDERERLEAYGEHIAAANGRPHVAGVVIVPVGDDEQTP